MYLGIVYVCGEAQEGEPDFVSEVRNFNTLDEALQFEDKITDYGIYVDIFKAERVTYVNEPMKKVRWGIFDTRPHLSLKPFLFQDMDLSTQEYAIYDDKEKAEKMAEMMNAISSLTTYVVKEMCV